MQKLLQPYMIESQALTLPSRRTGMPSATVPSFFSAAKTRLCFSMTCSSSSGKRHSLGQRADVAQHAHLGVLAHGAGVHDDHVGLKLVLGKAVAHLGEIAAQLFAVGLVLLAAVGVHHRERTGAV